MSVQVTNTDRYPATPDQLIDMMSNPDYLLEKYQALGDVEFTVDEQERADESLSLKIDRTVNANLPDFAKKIVGETSQLVQTEKWTKDGDSWVCDFHTESPGKPLKMNGTFKIVPVGDSESDYSVQMDIKAGIPLVGKKLEKSVASETKENMSLEFQFNVEFL